MVQLLVFGRRRHSRSFAGGRHSGCLHDLHAHAGDSHDYADFGIGILDVNKAAGLLTLLENGMPKVDGHSDLNGKTVVDVGGWVLPPEKSNVQQSALPLLAQFA